MTNLELLAFVILPIGVGLLGVVLAWAARFIP